MHRFLKGVMIILIATLLLTSGCGFFKTDKSPQEPDTPPRVEQPQEPDQRQKDYYVGPDAPVERIEEWVNRYKLYEGVFVQRHGNYRLVLVSRGQKFLPGHSLILKEVRKQADSWLLQVVFKDETIAPDTEPRTYIPWEVVAVKNDGKSIKVVNMADEAIGEPLEVILIPEGEELPASKSFVIFSPIDGAVVKNPVRIKGKARVFEANFRVIVREDNKELASQVVMAAEGAPGWGEFELELPYDKPNGSNTEIIFAYENMENGELIEELVVPVKVR